MGIESEKNLREAEELLGFIETCLASPQTPSDYDLAKNEIVLKLQAARDEARNDALCECIKIVENFSVTTDSELTALFLKKNAASKPSASQICYGDAMRALKRSQ